MKESYFLAYEQIKEAAIENGYPINFIEKTEIPQCNYLDAVRCLTNN